MKTETLQDKLLKIDELYKEVIVGLEELSNNPSVSVNRPVSRTLSSLKSQFERMSSNYNSRIGGSLMQESISYINMAQQLTINN